MAKRYSRAHGNSGSKKPEERSTPSWMNYKPKEAEMIVVKLAKEGNSPSRIGMVLRDSYGIPDINVLTGKNITKILEEKKQNPEIPEDLMAVIRKSISLSKHLEENHKDFTAKRGLQLTDSRIKRLVEYYKKIGKLQKDFKFDRKSIKLYAQ
ncbi:MAG: 30S ribosomal protein S15 [Candidatus Woesearchaeota archaeon]